jgi:predicted DNA-binding protein (UPF0278 family)
MTPEQINDLRQRVIRGEQVSEDELREAIAALRNNRFAANNAAVAKAEKRSAKSAQSANLASIVAQALAGKLE